MVSIPEAAILCFAMGGVIFLCRVFPFIFFREKPGTKSAADEDSPPGLKERFLSMVEKTVPPAAMTVLAFNALAGPVKANPAGAIPVLAAAALSALLHLWKRNALLSIAAGTALYILLERLGAVLMVAA